MGQHVEPLMVSVTLLSTAQENQQRYMHKTHSLIWHAIKIIILFYYSAFRIHMFKMELPVKIIQ